MFTTQLSSARRDIVVTWPKKRSLDDYLTELSRADAEGLAINYRVSRMPRWPDAYESHGSMSWSYGVERPRCFMVHSGFVRGWCEVLYGCRRTVGEVSGWPAGLYVVRSPVWNPVDSVPMESFRGWRWYGA